MIDRWRSPITRLGSSTHSLVTWKIEKEEEDRSITYHLSRTIRKFSSVTRLDYCTRSYLLTDIESRNNHKYYCITISQSQLLKNANELSSNLRIEREPSAKENVQRKKCSSLMLIMMISARPLLHYEYIVVYLKHQSMPSVQSHYGFLI
mgnify:CR=1 FL=1